MNLYHFEQAVNSVILKRGFAYYETGHVSDLAHEGKGRYSAVVEGTDTYEIVVQIDENDTILSSECDCPYDMGPICKHEVAVYYELVDRRGDVESMEEAIDIPTHNAADLKTILEGLSKAQLIDILIGLSDYDSTLHNRLIFNYVDADGRQEIGRCKELIGAISHKYMSRERYITYKYVGDFANDLSSVLDRIALIKDPLIAIEVAGVLLIEAIDSLQYADDSHGDIGSLIDGTIQRLDTIANETENVDTQGKLLNQLIHLAEDKAFDGWEDFRIDVLEICTVFASDNKHRGTLMNELESMIDESDEAHYKKYANERILNIMYEIMLTHGTSKEAREFLLTKVNYPSFRERLIQIEIAAENYEEVIALSFDGERKDKDLRSLVTCWRKWRYEGYKQLQSPREQEKLGRELLFDGNFEYYWDLKELASENHTSFYEQLKQELAAENGRMYLQLIEAEKDVDAILVYVRQKPSVIEEYMRYLMESHELEVVHLFATNVKMIAKGSASRSQYKGVCQILRRFRKIGGNEACASLVEELKVLYKRRPAFMDELSKL